MAEFLYRLGRAAAHRAKTVIAIWLALLLAAGASFALFGGELEDTFSIPGTPTDQVNEVITEEFPDLGVGSGTIVLQTEDGSAFTEDQIEEITDLIEDAEDVSRVEGVVDPFATEDEQAEQQEQLEEGLDEIESAREEIEEGREELVEARAQAEFFGMLDEAGDEIDANMAELEENAELVEEQKAELDAGMSLLETSSEIHTVSDDGSTALVNVSFSDPPEGISTETRQDLMSTFTDNPVDGVTVDFSTDIVNDISGVFGAGEVVGLIIAAIVLLIMLGTFIGAGLPILTALVGVGVGALAGLSLSDVFDMATVTPILGVMLGLAVGIDYSLFIINRHRHQLKQGHHLHDSIGLANGTAGNAVVFAGTTVLIALLGLNLTGIGFLGLMGTVGAISILVAVLIAVTLTPALLSLTGTRVLARRERARHAEPSASAEQTSEPEPMSTRRAIGRVVIAVAGLAILALPALDLHMGLPDGSTEPHDSTQYRAYTAVSEEFGPGMNGPLVVLADLPGPVSDDTAQEHQVEVAEEIYSRQDVVAVAPIGLSDDNSTALFQVVPEDGPTSRSTEDLVETLRGLSPIDGGDELGVAGTASGNIDISDTLSDALPTYLAVVVGLSLVILLVVFRSVFVPVVASLGFILSFFASLGGVVAIYQWGWLGGIFDVDTPGPVLNFLPTLLVGILFGLAMDYMLFLGTGMREAYVRGAPSRIAVVQGFRAGRAVVTAAAVIMISVFAGFVFSHLAMIRPVGFALAFGVLIDAFVVRMTLIPALMHLAGDAAWWLPRWLDRILPNIDVEGSALEQFHGRDTTSCEEKAQDTEGDGRTDDAEPSTAPAEDTPQHAAHSEQR